MLIYCGTPCAYLITNSLPFNTLYRADNMCPAYRSHLDESLSFSYVRSVESSTFVFVGHLRLHVYIYTDPSLTYLLKSTSTSNCRIHFQTHLQTVEFIFNCRIHLQAVEFIFKLSNSSSSCQIHLQTIEFIFKLSNSTDGQPGKLGPFRWKHLKSDVSV